MLSNDQAEAAAALLYRHWQDGRRTDHLPPALRPRTRADGYAIQARLERNSAAPLFGWKIAATSQEGQQHINVDGPLAGRLLAERVYDDGATVPMGANAMRVAEPEFAFRMAEDLPPRTNLYEAAEVLDAVGSLHPAIELPDSRFDDFTVIGGPGLIADNACAHDFVLGAATDVDWRELDLVRHSVAGSVVGKIAREGFGSNVLGDPRVALAWLVNELSSLDITLSAGQVVTTGTCLQPLPIAAGDAVEADFGVLGRVSVQLS